MQAHTSSEGADIPSTNAKLKLHDASGVGGNDAVPGIPMAASDSGHKAANNRSISASSSLPREGARKQSGDPSGATSKNGRQATQDAFLQIPTEGGATIRRPIETSIWDWDTPLESVGAASSSSSLYYEPQGELLQEQRDQRQARHEFSIPHAVAGASSAAHWPFPPSAVGTRAGGEGLAASSRAPGIPQPLAGSKRKLISDREGAAASNKQDELKRPGRIMSETTDEPTSPAHNTRSQSGPSVRQRSSTEASESRPRPSTTDVEPTLGSTTGPQRSSTDSATPMVLPARKVFPIQIGDKLFRLSGASISSDAPSYFTQFFEEQLRQNEGADNVRTLYIDRDPTTFEDISLHLQGYHIEPRDGPHFVKLFADAQFFSLPRLTAQLFSSTIYIRIGDEEFQIPRDLFASPGDSPNYFSLGFSIFFTSPTEVFPGLSQRALLRPPSILPPSVPNRSAKTFADLLHVLKGYPLEIRSEEHRAELLRDARYFHLKGLEQRLIPHDISYNLARKSSEILVRLGDIRQSGISFVLDSAAAAAAGGASSASEEANSPDSASTAGPPTGPGWVYYQRPYVDSEAYGLIVEVNGEENVFLSLAPRSSSSAGGGAARIGRATFYRQTLARITSLFSVIANKMNLPVTQPLGLMLMERGAGVASLPVSPGNTGLSDDRVKVRIGADADVTLDGRKWLVGEDDGDEDDESEMDIDPSESSRTAGQKRKRREDEENEGEEWVVKRVQWRLRVQPVMRGAQAGRTGMEVILGAVKIEAYSTERARNVARGFLV